MGYPRNGSSYPDLKYGTVIEKAEQNKLKQFAEQLKSVFVLVIAWFLVQLTIYLTRMVTKGRHNFPSSLNEENLAP